MSVYSRKSSKPPRSEQSFKSWRSAQSLRSARSNNSKRSAKTIRTKLLEDIKSKHGVGDTRPWHIEQSALDHIKKPNPFKKLIGSHKNLEAAQQTSVCSTLTTCIEIIVSKKGGKLKLKDDVQSENNNANDDDEKDNKMKDTADEVIDESVKATPTEIFGVFMTLMEQKNSDQHEVSIMVLLSYLIPALPTNVVISQFDHLARKIGECFSSNIDNAICIEYALQCMSSMLLVRISSGDTDALWENPFCQKMLQGLFVFAADDQDKLRKKSLKYIERIFGKYPANGVPRNMKRLMRHFMENQIESVIREDKKTTAVTPDGDGDGAKKDGTVKATNDLNVIAYLCELAMATLQYLTLRECAECISLLFNAISFAMQSIGDNSYRFKNLNLQQMFLKLTLLFIKSLPRKFKMKPSKKRKAKQTEKDSKIEELAHELKDKVDLKQLMKNTKLEDVERHQFECIQSDTVGIPIYFKCLVAVISSLNEFNREEALNRAVSIVTLILDGFDSNKKKNVESAQQCISRILQVIVTTELIQETKALVGGADDLPPLFEHTPTSSPASTSKESRQKLPVLQRIVVMIERLLDFKYQSCWLSVFTLCADLFGLFGQNGFFLLCNILTELSELRCMQKPPFKSDLEDAIGDAIRHCGPENVLSVISLNMPTAEVLQLVPMDKAILKANLWLLPLLQSNISRTTLSFFGQRLLPIADMMMKQSQDAKAQDMVVHSKQFDAMAHQIWRIFPSFCIYPSDVTETFPKIAEPIAFYMMTLVSVRRYIISGFVNLLKKPLEWIRRQNERGHFGGETIRKSKEQVAALKPFAANYMPILCNILVETEHMKRDKTLKAIALFAEVADKEYLATHFKKTMVKWLEDDTQLLLLRKQLMDDMAAANSTEDADEKGAGDEVEETAKERQRRLEKKEEQRMERLAEMKEKYEKLLNQETAYLLILKELVAFVDLNEIEQFWEFLKQQFVKKDQSPLIQKLLYRSLRAVLQYRDCVLIKDRMQLINFVKFMLSVHGGGQPKNLPPGARFDRLMCIHTLLDCLAEIEVSTECFVPNGDGEADSLLDDDSKNELDMDPVVDVEAMQNDENSFLNVYGDFIAELISNAASSSIKNKKEALQIIELIAMRIDDISSDLLNKFVLKLMGSLLSVSHEMQSATILSLTYLVVQLELRIPAETLGELLKTISLRIVDPARTVIKASLDFIQIVIVEMPDAILEPNLMDVLTTVLRWLSSDKESRFKNKLNKCIDLLIRRFGYERITQMLPQRFQRLVNYLRKRANYLDNKREQRKQEMRDSKKKNKLFEVKLDNLAPDHPLNVAAAKRANDELSDDSDDDGKLTVFEQMKTERLGSKSGRTRFSDVTSVRMRIDGGRGVTDLSSVHSVNKHLVSEKQANRMLNQEQRFKDLGMSQRSGGTKHSKKSKKHGDMKGHGDHVYETKDGRLVITDSDTDDEMDHLPGYLRRKRRKQQTEWKNLSDEEDAGSGSDLSDGVDYNDDRDVDDVLTQYSKHNKTTQLKKALADVSRRGSSRSRNKRMSEQHQLEVVAKRRKIFDSMNNDAWLPGELQPFGYHVISPALLSKKQSHSRESTFKQLMGTKKRAMSVRTDSMASNYIKVSRTRKVSHGRYTLARGKIKAKQKHLLMDIRRKHTANERRKRFKKNRRDNKRVRKMRIGMKRPLSAI